MSSKLYRLVKRTPYLWRYAEAFRESFPGSPAYWEARYSKGGNSGAGSYGHLADFKATILNDFVACNQISSVIEFGCGDGNQLLLATYPRYIGLDVSRSAIRRCISTFKADPTKSFFLYDPYCFSDALKVMQADLALSLDVIYHLVEDGIFHQYMRDLFASAMRYVIIYSSDHQQDLRNTHVRHRKFSDYVQQSCPEWRLMQRLENRYPQDKFNEAGSFADFFVYQRAER